MRVALLLTSCLVAAGCGNSSAAHHEDRTHEQDSPTQLHLEVTISGQRSAWSAAEFAKAPHYDSANHSGAKRDTWSLRALVEANAGGSARLVSVTGADGRHPIDAAAWADPTRVPILHSTRRGTLKFRWADDQGTWGPVVAKDVTALEIAR